MRFQKNQNASQVIIRKFISASRRRNPNYSFVDSVLRMSDRFSVAKLFPKCLTTCLYIWTAYITLTRIHQIPSWFLAVTIIPTLLVALYTYFKAIAKGPGSPLDFPDLLVHDLQAAENGLELPQSTCQKGV